MSISENIAVLKHNIPPHVKLIAVSKTIALPLMMEAYKTGQRAFGENKVQEILLKYSQMPPDTEWHLIGHLQTNKVRQVLPCVQFIHSVDSLKLLSEINKEASKIKKVINCLLQIRIASEETKFGLSKSDAESILLSAEYAGMQNIQIKGLMGMASFTNDINQVKAEFSDLASFFHELKNRFFYGNDSFNELSMGMSGDFKIAIEAGSTMVRIGSLIFGERNYNV